MSSPSLLHSRGVVRPLPKIWFHRKPPSVREVLSWRPPRSASVRPEVAVPIVLLLLALCPASLWSFCCRPCCLLWLAEWPGSGQRCRCPPPSAMTVRLPAPWTGWLASTYYSRGLVVAYGEESSQRYEIWWKQFGVDVTLNGCSSR